MYTWAHRAHCRIYRLDHHDPYVDIPVCQSLASHDTFLTVRQSQTLGSDMPFRTASVCLHTSPLSNTVKQSWKFARYLSSCTLRKKAMSDYRQTWQTSGPDQYLWHSECISPYSLSNIFVMHADRELRVHSQTITLDQPGLAVSTERSDWRHHLPVSGELIWGSNRSAQQPHDKENLHSCCSSSLLQTVNGNSLAIRSCWRLVHNSIESKSGSKVYWMCTISRSKNTIACWVSSGAI